MPLGPATGSASAADASVTSLIGAVLSLESGAVFSGFTDSLRAVVELAPGAVLGRRADLAAELWRRPLVDGSAADLRRVVALVGRVVVNVAGSVFRRAPIDANPAVGLTDDLRRWPPGDVVGLTDDLRR